MVNEWTGRIAALLIIPLFLIVSYDVILRYVFNRPTVWAWDVNVQFLGAAVALGGGYTLLHNSHIGVDILVASLSTRKRVILELITSFFFFIGIGALLREAGNAAWFSVGTREVDYTFFAPPVYPLKVVIALGFFLLFLQGIAKFVQDFISIVNKKGSIK